MVAMKTGLSIWNSGDFQNVSEDSNKCIDPRRETKVRTNKLNLRLRTLNILTVA